MGFEVPVSGVDRPPARGGRLVAAGLLVLATVVAAAVATAGAAPNHQRPVVPSGGPSADTNGVAAGPSLPRPLPTNLNCRDVDGATCRRMAKAAMLALPAEAPDAIDATVWRSLLCNSTFDCPPTYIEGSAPLGSVIIRFADGGPSAAVNVVEGRSGAALRTLRAWVVRWIPELG